uniref:Uncharacterized protein AlNc14C72G4932 n=1 Tax=Albugo laibachii Nc14 TaxID=890382 RepID=F0WE76_9STRA|nr:conserved hypothetical protein [Albugo laibachii Nc14]|eukprot:CCA19505.1 conserved hypothetical protein [Albugo laibachii Nc14]
MSFQAIASFHVNRKNKLSKCAMNALRLSILYDVFSQALGDTPFPDTRVSLSNAPVTQFSCFGAARNCPDNGDYVAAGGNLTITILEMRNLPNLDHFGHVSLQTDAFLRVRVGNTTKTSDVIPNSLNPIWPSCARAQCDGNDIVRDMNFGFQRAGNPIILQVWDQDSGLEFHDDLIKSKSMNVIYCSTFSARMQRVHQDDSPWKLASQPLCVEQSWIPLTNSATNTCYNQTSGKVSTKVPCMLVRQTVLPFQMRVEQIYLQNASVLGGMAGYYPEYRNASQAIYGRVFTDLSNRLVTYYRMDRSKGGLLVRFQSELQNAQGNLSLFDTFGFGPYARITINYPAEMFVFRVLEDAKALPEWLTPAFGWTVSRELARITNFGGEYAAYARNVSPHAVNSYGDAMDSGIITGMNVPRGFADKTSGMYFIILQPKEFSETIAPDTSIEFTRVHAASLLGQFGITFTLLCWMLFRFLQRLNWRIERASSFFAQQEAVVISKLPGKPAKKAGRKHSVFPFSTRMRAEESSFFTRPSTMSMLFSSAQNEDLNATQLRRFSYANCIVYLCLMTPLLILIAWGITAILIVSPSSLGLALIFLGSAVLFAAFALLRWKHTGWRMSNTIFKLLLSSFFFTFTFLFSATLTDPRAFVGGQDFDFLALTSIFLTANLMPMLCIAFSNDQKLRKSLSQVLAVIGASKKINRVKQQFKTFGTLGLQLQAARAKTIEKSEKDVPARRGSMFTPLMGDHYSISSRMPGLERADVLQSSFVTLNKDKRTQQNRRYYQYAILVLAIYIVVALIWTKHGTLALGITSTVLFVDFCMFLVSRGALSWSAGFMVFLMSVTRVCLIITAGEFWIIGHALLYTAIGIALIREIVGKHLPRMTEREASMVALFGSEKGMVRPQFDLSNKPEFVLGLLSFVYVFLLLLVGFRNDISYRVGICGEEWPLWLFGVLAFIFVVFSGLALATNRALFLQKEGLLPADAARLYFFSKSVTLPFILASALEVLLICAGLFVYASTGSSFALEVSIFGPLLFITALPVYNHWCRNDYRLIIWPPDDSELVLGDDEDDVTEFNNEKDAEIERLRHKITSSEAQIGEEHKGFSTIPLSLKTSWNHRLGMDGKGLEEDDLDEEQESKVALLLGGNRLAKIQYDRERRRSTVVGSDRSTNLAGIYSLDSKHPAGWTKDSVVVIKEPQTIPESTPFLLRMGDHLHHLGATLLNRCSKTVETMRSMQAMFEENSHGKNWDEVDFNALSVYQAFISGFLLPKEYAILICFTANLLLIFIFGMVVTATEEPVWLGHLIWTGGIIFVFSFFPIVKYFRIGSVVTLDIKRSLTFSYVFAWLTGIVFFLFFFKMNLNRIEPLVILSILFYAPVFIFLMITIYKWRMERYDPSRAVTRTFIAGALVICMCIFEIYVFASAKLGLFLILVGILMLFLSYYFTQYIHNNMYLAPKHQVQARKIIWVTTIAAVGSGFFFGLNFFTCVSIAVAVMILKNVLTFCAQYWLLFINHEMVVYFSPYVFPVYAYDASRDVVIDCNSVYKLLYVTFILVIAWGAAAVLFVQPIGFGIGVCSIGLLTFAVTTAHLCASTPVQMGIAAKFVSEKMVKDASTSSKKAFDAARSKFQIVCSEFNRQEDREKIAAFNIQAITLGSPLANKASKQIEVAHKPQIDLSASQNTNRNSCAQLAAEIHSLVRSCFTNADIDATMTSTDSVMRMKGMLYESFSRGIGPLGFLYAFRVPKLTFQYLRQRYFPIPLPDAQQSPDVEEVGQRQVKEEKYRRRKARMGLLANLLRLPTLDEELDREYFHETKCVIHFQLLLLDAVDGRLAHTKILFQKFLREDRFKHISSGINIPSNVFRSSSLASVDLPLVAVWLQSLGPEAQSRFHMLRTAFSAQVERADSIIDAEDEQTRQNQLLSRLSWLPHEKLQCRKRAEEFYARRHRRGKEGQIKKNAPISLEAEALLNAQECIMEIESGFSCIVGDFGRSLQYVDTDFPPNQTSVANCSCQDVVKGWKTSIQINSECSLFDAGTDPDDVCVGRLNDLWLLSAISIIAASGGIDDGKVDPLIDQLFITKQTSMSGAYAMRIFKNSQWETVIVDDYFPILDGAFKTTHNAGVAFAYSPRFNELWVPLLEKAYAKYHGGFAALEKGYVHHALQELTGYSSEEVLLAQASRGIMKRTLWKQMLRFKSNKFLMGAGTLNREHADPDMLDTGLVFSSCYVVYDVRQVDQYQLLLLRNPPGDHPEWKGDWSDSSRFWTRRLRRLLNYTPDVQDNKFWMSFDDFCHAFRSLYVCRYYDPTKWPSITMQGSWRTNDTAGGLPSRHNSNCEIAKNPQYLLQLDRPTEIIIHVTQVDPSGIAAVDVQPFGIYVVAPSQASVKRTREVSLVAHLNKENVVAFSGEVKRERQIQLTCELAPRTYTILVATYRKEMEGFFRMAIQSNYPVKCTQLWPPVRKEKGEVTTTGKIAQTIKQNAIEKKKVLGNKIAASAQVMEIIMKDDGMILREKLSKQVEATDDANKNDPKSKSEWIERWDAAAGKPFYYNRKTGRATWDQPTN